MVFFKITILQKENRRFRHLGKTSFHMHQKINTISLLRVSALCKKCTLDLCVRFCFIKLVEPMVLWNIYWYTCCYAQTITWCVNDPFANNANNNDGVCLACPTLNWNVVHQNVTAGRVSDSWCKYVAPFEVVTLRVCFVSQCKIATEQRVWDLRRGYHTHLLFPLHPSHPFPPSVRGSGGKSFSPIGFNVTVGSSDICAQRLFFT